MKLTLRVSTLDAVAGDVIEVSDKATADALVANGHAYPVKAAPKSDKD